MSITQVEEALGESRIRKMRRLYFVKGSETHSDGGALELTLDRVCLLFDCGEDGDSLAVRIGPWEDPFVEPLSPENRTWVEQNGKWAAFELQSTDLLCDFMEKSIHLAQTYYLRTGNALGMRIYVDNRMLRIEASGDELHVSVQ